MFKQYLAEINYLKIWKLRVQKNEKKKKKKILNIKKIAFKVSFDISTVGNLQSIFMEHDLYLMS